MDVTKIRDDFPIFKNHPKLIYFDNAATTFKPQCVIDAINDYYLNTANIGRGEYDLANQVTTKIQSVRENIAKFIHAEPNEVIFTSGTSEALNYFAFSFGREILKENDVVLTTSLEHASCVLPWMKVCEEKKANLDYLPLLENGRLDLQKIENMLNPNVKIIVISHISNTLGYINDIQKICKIAHAHQVYVLVDAAQSSAHLELNVKEMDCDFLAFSSHKMYGPTGVGVLYGKHELLTKCVPLYYGGGSNARYEKNGEILLKDIPERFETGTLAIESILGLDAAIKYIQLIGLKNIHEKETQLKNYLIQRIKTLKHVTVYNTDTDTGIILLNVDKIFAQDVASYLNMHQIAVRSGQHCAKTMDVYEKITIRISLAFYNTFEEIDEFINALKHITLEDTLDIFF